MSTKSKKVVNKGKISEVLKQKGKDMLGEAFEGVGGVVTMRPIHNLNGAFTRGSVKSVNEGPAYEYAKHIKNIDKAWELTEKSVMGLVKDLKKKGFKDEAFKIEKNFQASFNNFDHYHQKEMDKLQ